MSSSCIGAASPADQTRQRAAPAQVHVWHAAVLAVWPKAGQAAAISALRNQKHTVLQEGLQLTGLLQGVVYFGTALLTVSCSGTCRLELKSSWCHVADNSCVWSWPFICFFGHRAAQVQDCQPAAGSFVVVAHLELRLRPASH